MWHIYFNRYGTVKLNLYIYINVWSLSNKYIYNFWKYKTFLKTLTSYKQFEKRRQKSKRQLTYCYMLLYLLGILAKTTNRIICVKSINLIFTRFVQNFSQVGPVVFLWFNDKKQIDRHHLILITIVKIILSRYCFTRRFTR